MLAAGRERVGLQVHGRRRQAHPLRARRDPQRRDGRDRLDPRGARARSRSTSLFDLCERVDLRLCNKRVFEALIHSGALDGLGGHRAQYMAVLDTAMQEASLKQEEREQGQGRCSAGWRRRTGGATENGRRRRSRRSRTSRRCRESERLTQGEGDPRLLHLRASARAVPGRVRAVRDAHGVAARDVDRGGDVARRRRHGHQATGQQAVGRGVRPVDSRGFFGIFGGAGLPGSLGGAVATGSGRMSRCWSRAATRGGTRGRTTRRSSSSRSSASRSCGSSGQVAVAIELSASRGPRDGRTGTG